MIRQFLLGTSLITIVGLFLLVWDSRPQSFLRKQPGQVEKIPSADSYMNEVISHRFSKDGAEQLIISAPKIQAFSGDKGVVISQPSVTNLDKQTGTSAVTLDAQLGLLSHDGQTLTLSGDVVAVVKGERGNTKLSTASLSYQPATNIASTEVNFKLVTPQVKISGQGLDANLTKEVFTIKSKVHAVHDPL